MKNRPVVPDIPLVVGCIIEDVRLNPLNELRSISEPGLGRFQSGFRNIHHADAPEFLLQKSIDQSRAPAADIEDCLLVNAGILSDEFE